MNSPTQITGEKYSQLVAKIIQAVPEIMELKIGNRAIWWYDHQIGRSRFRRSKEGLIVGRSSRIDQNNWGSTISYIHIVFDGNKSSKRLRCDEVKPFQRPITLEDVLLTLGQNYGNFRGDIQVDEEGTIKNCISTGCGDEDCFHANWNLGESLSSQSNETKLWLWQLLCSH